MKHFLFIGLVLFSQGLSAQRIVHLGDSIVQIRGENITSYQEVNATSELSFWVEGYLFLSKDSIIITELRADKKADSCYKVLFVLSAKRISCDLNNISVDKNDVVKKPKNLLRLTIPCTPTYMIIHHYQGKRFTTMKTYIMDKLGINVKDKQQAKEIIKKLRTN